MKTKKTDRTKPFSLRLSFVERAALERRAGNRPLGDYIRECVLGAKITPRKPSRARPRKVRADKKAMAQVLGVLGQSEIAKNLRTISEHVKLGTLLVTEETEREIDRALSDIEDIRAMLIRALGIDEDREP